MGRCTVVFLIFALTVPCAGLADGKVALERKTLTLGVGEAIQLHADDAAGAKWESADSKVAAAYQNGFVIGLKPGTTRVRVGTGGGASDGAECAVTVKEVHAPLIDPATLKQYDDTRKFSVDGRVCYGSELNGRRADDPEEHKNLESNRVVNPRPLRKGSELEWEVAQGTEVYDGAGMLMGTVLADLKTDDGRMVPSSKFNFGMSKVMDGRVFLYAFAVGIKPSNELAKILDASEKTKTSTSAWLPLDSVVDKETLLELIHVGKVSLPHLPLEKKGFRITGGDPKQYITEFGEVRIVKDPAADPVPSHYLRRPSGTVNIIYSVPGYGLGGQGLDAFLVTDGIVFHPAKGAKVFVQPTYYPAKHPQAGKKSPMTMTFIYGAAEVKGVEPVYGWVAKQALEPIK